MTPFRSEKNTNWEGAFRVPEMIRWPGQDPGGRRLQRDRPAPRLAADVPRRRRRARRRREAQGGPQVGDTTYKVHIDGYNLLPYLTGEVEKSPRQGLIYFSDDGDVLGSASTTGRSCSWSSASRARCRSGPSRSSRCACPSSSTCAPTRSSAPTSPRTPTRTGSSTTTTSFFGTAIGTQFLQTFEEFPPRQKPARFTIDQVVAKLRERPHGTWPADEPRRPGTTAPTRSAILDFVARVTDRGRAGLRPARRADRGLRQRRHAVVREADAHPGASSSGGSRELAAADPALREPAAVKAAYEQRPALARRRDGQALPRRRRRPETAAGSHHDARSTRSPSRSTTAGDGVLRRRRHPRSGAPTGPASTRRWSSCSRYLSAQRLPRVHRLGRRRDFMRPVAGELYGVPPDDVIGSALGRRTERRGRTRRALQGRDGLLRRRAGEAIHIWSRIGRRPIVAVGNTAGDLPNARVLRTRGPAVAAPARPPRRRRARVRLRGRGRPTRTRARPDARPTVGWTVVEHAQRLERASSPTARG